MCGEIKIMCANRRHQEVIVHFLEQIQLYVDEITKDDEDFVVFINVLEELVRKSNKNVIFSFLGGNFTQDWMSELPTTVYYAVVGYMHLIQVGLHDLMDTTEKINNLVGDTLFEIENMEEQENTYYEIYLN